MYHHTAKWHAYALHGLLNHAVLLMAIAAAELMFYAIISAVSLPLRCAVDRLAISMPKGKLPRCVLVFKVSLEGNPAIQYISLAIHHVQIVVGV